MLFNNLTEHLESEENHQRKCKMSKSDIDNFATRIASCAKVIEEESQQADNIKKDLDKLQQETEELKKKEVDVKDLISRHKLQMSLIEKDCVKGLEEIEIKQENEENELKKKLDEQVKVRDELQSKQMSLMNQQKFGIEEITELQKRHSDVNARIDELRERIKEIEDRDSREKRSNDEKKSLLNHAKVEKDSLKEAKMHLELRIGELDREIEQTAENLRGEKKAKDEQHRVKVKLDKQKEQFEKDYGRKVEEVQKFEGTMAERDEECRSKEEELQDLLRGKGEVERDYELAKTVRNQVLGENEELGRRKTELLEMRVIEQEELERLVG